MVKTESCQHLVWTVIFLSDVPYSATISQTERFQDLISKVRSIPFRPDGRFNEFIIRLADWQSYSQRDEFAGSTEYFLLRRDEVAATDLVLRQGQSGQGNRTQIDINISL
jgi:hypothetical protein